MDPFAGAAALSLDLSCPSPPEKAAIIAEPPTQADEAAPPDEASTEDEAPTAVEVAAPAAGKAVAGAASACCAAASAQPGKARRHGSAKELRDLLPRAWRHFHGPRRGMAAQSKRSSKAHVLVPLDRMRHWLRQLKRPEGNDELSPLFGGPERPAVALRQRLGFRFRDPSDSGTWSATNLIGHAERPVGPPSRMRSEIFWDYYEACFEARLCRSGHAVRLERALVRRPLSAICEKRKRGHPDGPLTRERMVFTAASRVAKSTDKRRRICVQKGTCDLLPAVIFRPPSGPQQWTLIYLHGLGSSAMNDYADRPHYFFDGSVMLKVVIPTAPSREVSCYDTWWVKGSGGAWRLNRFRSWYDYLSDNGGVREDSIDWASLHVVQKALHSLVESEAAELGGRADRVILGGKSQGCCTSLDAALTFPRPLGGFVGLVGHLLSCTPVERGGPQSATPMHFFHEPDDHLMRWKWVSRGERRLRDAGYVVRSRRRPDPETHSHFIAGVEGQWIRSALRSICRPPGRDEC